MLPKRTACFPRCKSGKAELLADICTKPRMLTNVLPASEAKWASNISCTDLVLDMYAVSVLLGLNRVTGSIEKRIWERLFG